jgi:hypothetical protein
MILKKDGKFYVFEAAKYIKLLDIKKRVKNLTAKLTI